MRRWSLRISAIAINRTSRTPLGADQHPRPLFRLGAPDADVSAYDLRDWVPPDHIVHFILDAVEQVPITDFRVNERIRPSGDLLYMSHATG